VTEHNNWISFARRCAASAHNIYKSARTPNTDPRCVSDAAENQQGRPAREVPGTPTR
jgi:hypothetical protein